MYCRECGNKLEHDIEVRFCSQCGHNKDGYSQNGTTNNSTSKDKKMVVALLVVGLLIMTFILYISNNTSQNQGDMNTSGNVTDAPFINAKKWIDPIKMSVLEFTSENKFTMDGEVYTYLIIDDEILQVTDGENNHNTVQYFYNRDLLTFIVTETKSALLFVEESALTKDPQKMIEARQEEGERINKLLQEKL